MLARTTITILVSVFSIYLGSACALAEDWPHWRGPDYNGISSETDWGGDLPNCYPSIVWDVNIGTGFGSISVAEGRVYVMGNTGTRDDRDDSTDRDVVYCFDANSGEVLWSHSYLARLDDRNYEGGPSCTPTVAGGKVYTLGKRGVACCLDADDGDVVWERDLAALYGVVRPSWGFASSAFIDGDLVIYNAGKNGIALYKGDGTAAWETGTSRSGYSTPVPFDWDGQRLLILMGEKTFTTVKAGTGELVWDPPVTWVTGSNVNAADPIVYGNQVFICSGYDTGAALFDVNTSTNQLTEIWSNTDMKNKINSSVLWEGYLYGPHEPGGALRCVELSTGAVKWSEGGFGYGGLTLADGKLIALTEGGNLRIVEASPTGYHELGRGEILPSRCWAVPVLANGKIYARNSTYERSNPGKLVCVELKTTAPVVDAGMSCVTWLKDGIATVDLSGTVEDDTGDVSGVLWSVVQPDRAAAVEISDDESASTTADFLESGVYVLELYAVDSGGQEDTDRMVVRVYGDSCEAANSPIHGGAGAYDYDSDCIATFSDFAVFAGERSEAGNFNDLVLFAEDWLEDKSLGGDVLYDAGEVSLPVE